VSSPSQSPQRIAPNAGRPAPSLQERLAAALPGSQPESVSLLATSARLREVRPGDLIFRQGDPIPLTLLLSGHAAFRRTTADGQLVVVGVAYPGELFGMSSVAGTVASTEMVALTDAVVLSWRGLDVRRLAETDPKFALLVIDRLSLFATMLTEKLDGFLHQDARRRVIRVLARHRDLFFSDSPILTRTHLPGLVGTSREMTGRVLRALERERVIARVGRTGLRLLDARPLDSLPREVTNQPAGKADASGPVLA
jgi:CRP-like cAMP-binding protein